MHALLFRTALMFALVVATSLACAQSVLVAASDRSVPYNQASEAIVREWTRAGGSASDIQLVVVSDTGALAGALQRKPRLVVALGVEALRDVVSEDARAPILAALIPRVAVDRLQRQMPKRFVGPLSVVYLDQPPGRQLDLLQLALPGLRGVGVLWGPESSSQRGAFLSAAAARRIDIAEAAVSDEAAISIGLRATLADVDALVALADPAVYNGATISNILLASYRAKVPMLAFSPAYVKAGALFALYSTPTQIGTQTGLLARAMVAGNSVGVTQSPTEFSVSVNEHVARSLGLALDAAVLAERLRVLERRP